MISFWLDPGCPFTWHTSRWLREVAGRRDERVQWRFLSLALLNEGRELPERYRRSHAWSHRALRMLAAADARYGQPAVDRLYTVIGTRLHDDGVSYDDALLTAAVGVAKLPANLVEAADDATWDAAVRESHEAAQQRVGSEAGSPVMAVDDGRAFFGPVIAAVPAPRDGERLLDALRLLSEVSEFSELKRARSPQ